MGETADRQPDLAQLRAQWDAQGYVLLRGFYDDGHLQPVLDAVRDAWAGRAPRLVVDDMDSQQRMLLRQVDPDSAGRRRFKLNDLYLESPAVRALALNPRLTPILQALLGQPPALCNSLSLEYGTQQPDHVDSLYMTPETPGHLVAAWVALEDSQPGAGRLRYWPGSHRIAPYLFSNGSRHHVPAEMPQWHAYMDAQVQALGLQVEELAARKGDVLLWSAQLLHGGSPIQDPALTRRSLVLHYFSEADCRRIGSRLQALDGGWWVRRGHQPLPGSLASRVRGLAAGLRNRWLGRAGRRPL